MEEILKQILEELKSINKKLDAGTSSKINLKLDSESIFEFVKKSTRDTSEEPQELTI